MPIDDDDDLYNEEFDFVDDEDDSEELDSDLEDSDMENSDLEGEEEVKPKKKKKAAPRKKKSGTKKTPASREPRPAKKSRSRKSAKKVEESAEAPPEEQVEPEQENLEEPAQSEDQQESLDEFGRPAPVANYVVHVYEYKRYKRTIDRDFTPEDAETFATDYNHTAKAYGRVAVPGKKETPPRKTLTE